jgi:hypothetical protein
MIKINDIKTIVQIPDYSIFYLFAIIIFFSILVIYLFIKIYKYYFNQSKKNRKKYFMELEKIDLSDTKKASYLITKYSRLLVNNEENKYLFEKLNLYLEEFKYKKNVSSYDDEFEKLFFDFKAKIYV